MGPVSIVKSLVAMCFLQMEPGDLTSKIDFQYRCDNVLYCFNNADDEVNPKDEEYILTKKNSTKILNCIKKSGKNEIK